MAAGVEFLRRNMASQWEILFYRWRSLGEDVANLGNIVQNPQSVPLSYSEIQNYHELTQVTEKAFFRLVDETLDLIEGNTLSGNEVGVNHKQENDELKEENKRLREEAASRKNEAECRNHGHKWTNDSMIAKVCAPNGDNYYTCERCGEEKTE